MSLRLRKLFVWLVSVGVVFAIYLLYSQISETPRIDIDTASELTESESNVAEFDGEVGRIGDVGVGTVRKAKFIHFILTYSVPKVSRGCPILYYTFLSTTCKP